MTTPTPNRTPDHITCALLLITLVAMCFLWSAGVR